jgi:DNA-binding CsgD family transcriptional regulator
MESIPAPAAHKGVCPIRPYHRLTREECLAAVEHVNEIGGTNADLVRIYGSNLNQWAKKLEEYGIEPPTATRQKRQYASVIALLAEGKTQAEVSRQLHVKPYTVSRIAARAGLKRRKRLSPKEIAARDAAIIGSELSNEELAREYGCSESNIRRIKKNAAKKTD